MNPDKPQTGDLERDGSVPVDRTQLGPFRLPSNSPGFDPGIGGGEYPLAGGLSDTPVVEVEYNGGTVSVYSPWIVGLYYTELPLILDPVTEIFTPCLTDLTFGSSHVVEFQGNTGYVIGYFEYIYEDDQGHQLPDPEFEVAYQALDEQQNQLELLLGYHVISPQQANEQIDTTFTDPETGRRTVYFLLPSVIEDSPDVIGESERHLVAAVGFEGELVITTSTVSGEFIDIESSSFHSREDLANQMVPLLQKSDGSYYMRGEPISHEEPGTAVWLTPEVAETILGESVNPCIAMPTGQVYYDAYILDIEDWNINPLDLEGIDLEQPIYDIKAQAIENKFRREAGSSEPMTPLLEREPSFWLPNWWKKFFEDYFAGRLPSQYYPYGGNSPNPVGPTNYSAFPQCFFRGDILTANYEQNFENPLTWVPEWLWPYGWHHTGIVATDTYSQYWTYAETVEAIGFGQGVQRIPYARNWVYNRDIRAIRCTWEIWIYHADQMICPGVLDQLMTFFDWTVGQTYNLGVQKDDFNEHYCSQLAWVGWWGGAYFNPYWYSEDIDVDGGFWVTPGDIYLYQWSYLWWWWDY
ncbi:hypothetical protein J7K50_09995 [bacterium]|nr:hypothetical protein [bacterium]